MVLASALLDTDSFLAAGHRGVRGVALVEGCSVSCQESITVMCVCVFKHVVIYTVMCIRFYDIVHMDLTGLVMYNYIYI